MAASSVKRLATTLMDASIDKDPDVQEQIYSSLCFMGEAAPTEVLESCDSYLRQHDKLSHAHRTIILRAMETIVKNSLTVLTKETAKMVILLASNEMTKSKVASSVLEVGDGRSAAALRLLNVMQINIHPTVGRCWDQEIPSLLLCLEGHLNHYWSMESLTPYC
ncbi:hypothetical protein GDO86_019454 [Hymenochirus boettgeri]|uniref:MROH2B-like N-terminal HEAT-repeats domain-containing protein n=1 Tax=Hymenochirus boettgeri TaxID=247094 RepID=A0A8T2IIV2_9PIPI|nr:hypothetical protein GDO86_019454 [Hymenochirus boettgeri]